MLCSVIKINIKIDLRKER